MKERHRYLRRKGKTVRAARIGKLLHVPSGHGSGKWETFRGLVRYKLARRKRNLVARVGGIGWRREHRSDSRLNKRRAALARGPGDTR